MYDKYHAQTVHDKSLFSQELLQKLCLPVHRSTTVQTCEAHTIFMTTKSLTAHEIIHRTHVVLTARTLFKSPLPGS